MSTTHLPLPRRSAPALPLLGGPFHGEKYHTDLPPPALRLTTPEGTSSGFYVLHTPPDDTTHQSAAYVLESLDADREFLTRGGVFTNDMIDAYIALKYEEVQRFRMTTHPVEFDMYFSS